MTFTELLDEYIWLHRMLDVGQYGTASDCPPECDGGHLYYPPEDMSSSQLESHREWAEHKRRFEELAAQLNDMVNTTTQPPRR